MTDLEFGELVRAARTRRNWSQGELATRVKGLGVEISQGKVSLIEKGTQAANSEMRRALVELLDLSPGPPPSLPSPSSSLPPAVRDPSPVPSEGADELALTGGAPPPRVRRPMRRPRLPVGVADLPRTTLYLEHSTKRLLDAASRVTGRPAYKLLADAFHVWLDQLPPEDTKLIERLAQRTE